MAAFRGETALTRGMNATNERNWTVNDGANFSHLPAWLRGRGHRGRTRPPDSRGFFPNRVNDAYARRLVALAEERGVAAYLVLPPFVPQLNERRRQTGAEAKYLNLRPVAPGPLPAFDRARRPRIGLPGVGVRRPNPPRLAWHPGAQSTTWRPCSDTTSTGPASPGLRSVGSGCPITASGPGRPTWKSSSMSRSWS